MKQTPNTLSVLHLCDSILAQGGKLLLLLKQNTQLVFLLADSAGYGWERISYKFGQSRTRRQNPDCRCIVTFKWVQTAVCQLGVALLYMFVWGAVPFVEPCCSESYFMEKFYVFMVSSFSAWTLKFRRKDGFNCCWAPSISQVLYLTW